jgi:4a-hydroxytetrahydrobiopterin dehydratase
MIYNLAENNGGTGAAETAATRENGWRQKQPQANGGWRVMGERRLERQFLFPDFRQALDFTIRVGEVAEAQGRHPDIFLSGDEVRLQIRAQGISGLTEGDFMLAARLNAIK